MTPQEKSKNLVNKFYTTSIHSNSVEVRRDVAKKSALIAVDEILNHHSQEQGLYRIDQYYWQEVKTEIEKL